MCLLHNAILRGYNSVYLQAPHVQDADKADFISYCQTWYKFVKSHHDDEEAVLFTKVEDLLGDKTVWDETHKEHGMSFEPLHSQSGSGLGQLIAVPPTEAFLAGLTEFNTYLTSLKTPSAFSAVELRRIMSGFQEPFEKHYHSEIGTIAALADHPNTPKQGTPEEAAATATFKSWGKSTVTKAGVTDVVPFFLLNLDGTAEDGMWANWPPMPAPIRWGLVNIAGAFHSRWWKFASCDAAGKPRELWALQFPEVKA